MKKKIAAIVVLAVWGGVSVVQLEFGLMDALFGAKRGPLRHAEILFPAYCLGYWLGEPWHTGAK